VAGTTKDQRVAIVRPLRLRW